MVLHVKYAPVITNCLSCKDVQGVQRFSEKWEIRARREVQKSYRDVPLLKAVLLSVVPSTGPCVDEWAGILGTVVFAKVLVELQCSGRIYCTYRLQKLLNKSSLWLWVEWWIYPQKFELLTLEFLMLFPSYCAVHIAFLLSAFPAHQVPFLRPISLLIKPRRQSILSCDFWSSPLVSQGKSSDLKADIAENQLGCLTFLFNVRL